MSYLTASFTKAQVQLTTREDILKSVLRRTAFGQYGSSTAGSTTTLTDTTRLQSAEAYGDDYWNGAYLRVVTGSAAGTIRNITDYVASTGVLTFATATSPGTGADYELWKMVHPQEVLDMLDQILTEETFVPDWAVLTEIPDGDMEQNNTTDWTAGGSATLAKSTTEPTIEGVRYLTVSNSGANGYARSALILVPTTSRGYHVSVLVRCSSGTAKLIAYDETNGATLNSVTTTEKGWTRVWFDFNTASTTQSISIRLSGVETDAVTYWKSACLYPHNARDIRLPWWVKNRDHVRGFYRLRPDSGASTNTWDPSLVGVKDNGFAIQQSRFGQGQARAVVGPRGMGIAGPVYVYGLRNETAYASETEVKHLDLRWITAKLSVALYKRAMQTLALTGGQDQGMRAALNDLIAELQVREKAVLEDDEENQPVVANDMLVGRNRWGGY